MPISRVDIETPFFLKAGWALAFLYFFAVVFLAAAGHSFFTDLSYVVALRGFSIVEYLAHASEPLNFARDFPGGAYLSGDKSLVTKLYIPLKHLTGLSSITLLAGGIWLEVLSVVAGATVLWWSLVASLSEKPSRENRLERLFVGGWLVTVLVSGNVIKPNLSNFGAPFFHGQFYGYADALAFVALAAYLRGNWLFVTLAVIAAFAVHPIKAIMPCTVIAAAVLVNFRTDLNIKSLMSGACVALFASYWAVWELNLGSVAGVPDIPDDLFITYTRIQQYHWYPAVNGLLSSRQDIGLVPFFALLTIALVAGLKASLPRRTKSAFLAGYVALAVLTAWGVYNSTDLRSAFLIKLSLVRASEFMVQMSPFLICVAAYQTWRRSDWLWFAIFIGFLLTAMFPSTQPSLSLAVGASAIFIAQNVFNKSNKSAVILLSFVLSVFILMTQINWWRFSAGENPLLSSTWAFVAVASFYMCLKFSFERTFLTYRSLVVAIVLTLMFFSGAYAWLRHNSTLQGDMDVARSFYQAQKWANASTHKTALFMVDPCLNYGWRDFSERSSIGTPREWYMTGWLYVSDLRVFRWGQDIGETLGMDLSGMLPRRDQNAENQIGAMCKQANTLFYDVSRSPLQRVHRKFGVDYFVMFKDKSEHIVREYSIKSVYSNDYFRVFSAREYFK